jgi:hypothetical protein
VEAPDGWLLHGNPLEVRRPEYTYPVGFGGLFDPAADFPFLSPFTRAKAACTATGTSSSSTAHANVRCTRPMSLLTDFRAIPWRTTLRAVVTSPVAWSTVFTWRVMSWVKDEGRAYEIRDLSTVSEEGKAFILEQTGLPMNSGEPLTLGPWLWLMITQSLYLPEWEPTRPGYDDGGRGHRFFFTGGEVLVYPEPDAMGPLANEWRMPVAAPLPHVPQRIVQPPGVRR